MRSISKSVGGHKLEVFGANADLIHWVHSSPLAATALGAISRIEDDLFVAFGAADQNSRELSSKELIKRLWDANSSLGPNPFLETLSHFGFDRVFYANYRDHVCHQLKVYLLGLYAYDNCAMLRDGLDASFSTGSKEASKQFLTRWLVTAVYHDIGYVLENGQALAIDSKTWKEVSQTLNHTLKAPVSCVKQCGWLTHAQEVDIARSKRLGRREFEIPEHLEEWATEGNLFRLMQPEASRSGVVGLGKKTGLEEYWDFAKANVPRGEGRTPYYDHGIASALLLLQTWHGYRERIQGLLHSRPRELAGRVKELRGLMESVDAQRETMRSAAAAMALHNINRHQWDEGKLRAADLNLSGFKISLKDPKRKTPLAFLLGLVDSLQDWDRPRYRAAQEEDRNLLDQDISITAKDGRLWMFLPQDDAQYRRPETEGKSRYSTAIKAMKEYLEEESIDKIMCWGEADEAQDELPSLLAEFEREFGKNGLFGQTGTRGHRLEVTRDYALRIGLQKLLHAAHLIDKRVASSNLWVAAKVDNRGRPSFLRSEEREGYFSVRQLVEPSPSGMRLRALEVSYEPSAADQQSAAAECLVKRSVCIQRIAGTHFPSEEEQRRKITHIVGIPAKPARTGKGPVSITVDLSCQSGLTSAEEGEIVARADGVAKLLGRLARWAAKGQPSLPLRGR